MEEPTEEQKKESIEAIAGMFERYARNLRSGKLKVVDIEQKRGYDQRDHPDPNIEVRQFRFNGCSSLTVSFVDAEVDQEWTTPMSTEELRAAFPKAFKSGT